MPNRVKEYRTRRGLSQEGLAIKSGIGRSTISEIEAEKHDPTVSVAAALARALGVTIEELFCIEL